MTLRKKIPKIVCVTGVAGFVGFHTAAALLDRGYRVVGIDNLSPYYDVRIKRKRLALLSKYPHFTFHRLSIASYPQLEKLIRRERVEEIVHLAAQAGVRYSLSNPQAYAESNYLGTLNVFEAARHCGISRVIYASSSSVYGANTKQPMGETDRADSPLSLYAATKKANESLAFAYNHLFKIEMIGLRFFTVYGRWGRPDLALFKFTRRIMTGEPIELYNRGRMKRSFTHVSDIVAAIKTVVAQKPHGRNELYNLGGGEVVALTRFVEIIESSLGMKAHRLLRPMQPGDVPETIADIRTARRDLDFKPRMSIEAGIADFVQWFKENESFLLSLAEPKQ